MVRVRGWRWVWGVVVVCGVMATIARAQTFTTLVNFDGLDGAFPIGMELVQGSDGSFYGTTQYGGANGAGSVFKTNAEGALTRLHSFCSLAQCADGRLVPGSLVQGTSGLFYGTTQSGGDSGANGAGTVYEITTSGKLTTLHNFEYSDGSSPLAGLIRGANGDFYGTTQAGGANGGGTIFEISASGNFTSLYSFCSLPNCADGKSLDSSLVQGVDGNFYGATPAGGSGSSCSTSLFPDGCGTLFKLTPAGKLITLHSFCSLPNCADGSGPGSSLALATDGNLYGTTFYGGANCSPYGCGTIFKITAEGKLTTLYSFCSLSNCADGGLPEAPLVQATDGNLYGTTFAGGSGCGNGTGCGYGTIFKINPTGVLTTLHSFCSAITCTDGADPYGGLLQAANGIFYGTTEQGGTSNNGTVFSLNTGLGPFVSFIRNPAKVGQKFGILGYGLTGTSSVSLNGIPASFTAQSDTLLIATVPSGATSGNVTVTTPSGTLTSNVPFRVIP